MKAFNSVLITVGAIKSAYLPEMVEILLVGVNALFWMSVTSSQYQLYIKL